MRKLNEIINQIKDNNNNISELREVISFNRGGLTRNEIVSKCLERDRLELENKVLLNNANAVLFQDTFPVLNEILEKYKGKPAGDKTRDKMYKDFLDRTGYRFYFSTKWGGTGITITSTNYCYGLEVELTGKYENGKYNSFLIDNKVNPLTEEQFHIVNNPEYIPDINAYIAELKALKEEAENARIKYETARNKYNNFAVNGIDWLK